MDKKRRYFDSIADEWDGALTAEDHDRLVDIIDSLDVKTGSAVCDLGCGTGVLFDILRRRVGAGGLIVGVDFAPRAACKARRNFPFPNIVVVQADAGRLPFADQLFDLVISFAAFPHFPDPAEAVRQAGTILKPGGRMVILHLLGRTQLAQHHHHAGGPVGHDVLPDQAELETMFRRGGFFRVDVSDTENLFLAIGLKS
jgi:ubiquinone/menaquinone biosynthesis C-methylase UbiE